jgi:hypothetical protein
MYKGKYQVPQLKRRKIILKIESGKVVHNLKPFNWWQDVF